MAASLLLAACTTEDGVVITPPKRFDHAFHGKTTVIYLDTVSLHARCGPTALSCALIGPVPECVIWMNQIYRRYAGWRKSIMRHETAHCNGWPADHPK